MYDRAVSFPMPGNWVNRATSAWLAAHGVFSWRSRASNWTEKRPWTPRFAPVVRGRDELGPVYR